MNGEKENFNKLITDELKRQIEILIEYDSSIDTKTGIFLGFVFLVFAQLLLLGGIVSKLSEPLVIAYAAGMVIIFISIIIGIVAYTSRGEGGYPIGADITDLIEQQESGRKLNCEREIRNAMLEAFSENSEVAEHKSKYNRWMIRIFFIGLLVNIIIALWYLATTVV